MYLEHCHQLLDNYEYLLTTSTYTIHIVGRLKECLGVQNTSPLV
jgi:hypothetical protein